MLYSRIIEFRILCIIPLAIMMSRELFMCENLVEVEKGKQIIGMGDFLYIIHCMFVL